MPEPTSTPEPTATPQPTATPDPYTGYYIEDLRQQQFGQEGEIEIVATLEERPTFTRYQIAFPSDGLSIGGFMNVPAGDGPFPVVILNHGYMPPASYELLTYTTKYADALANAGFLVVHPNFRNHRGSDEGQNPFRIGYARDVLHLIPMAQRLPQADGQPVGLWGHSMGGGVVLRVLAVSDDVGAAVLYGSMSGDEAKNYEAIMGWSNGTAAQNGSLPETPDNVAVYSAISPINYVEYLRAPLAIHHGVQDEQVPFSWSEELAQRLDEAGIPYDFWAYEGQPHNFTGAGYDLLNERVIAFFGEHLR
jgi:dipeptidyl aminopeptidase/acylaminoacyl peptidase